MHSVDQLHCQWCNRRTDLGFHSLEVDFWAEFADSGAEILVFFIIFTDSDAEKVQKATFFQFKSRKVFFLPILVKKVSN